VVGKCPREKGTYRRRSSSFLITRLCGHNTQSASPNWFLIEVEIQDWPGIDTPLILEFRSITDWALPTDFTLDNVRLVTACQ